MSAVVRFRSTAQRQFEDALADILAHRRAAPKEAEPKHEHERQLLERILRWPGQRRKLKEEER
jgi:hypothetical protein